MRTERNRHKDGAPAPWSREKALSHLASLCAAAEQCEADLREKMRRHSLRGEDADAVIDYLYEHRFLDETRFARAYARDKSRLAGWGRIKIDMMLRSKRVAAFAIREALAAIPPDEYREAGERVARSAARSLDLTLYEDRAKLMRRMYARGFEPDLARDIISGLMAETTWERDLPQ